jgi:hypothetical protein
VQLVQYDERSVLGPGSLADDLAVADDIPAQVLALIIEE